MIAIQQPAPRQPQVSIAYRMPGEFLFREDPHLQHFIIDSSNSGELISKSGLIISYPACAFMSRIYQKRVFGPVEVVLKELYTPAEILLYGHPTTSDGALMEAFVQFQIRAFQDGQPLELIVPLQVSLPVTRLGEKSRQIHTYCGGASEIRAISGQKTFDWKHVSGLLFQNSGSPYRIFNIDRCGWWACQKPHISKGKKVMMSAKVIGVVPVSQRMEGLLLFRDIPAMVRMYPGIQGFTALNIPEGFQASVLLYGHDREQLFAGRSDWEISSGKMYHVPVAATSREAFRDLLSIDY